MSDQPTPTPVPGLLTGRWQMPLAMLAAALAIFTLLRLTPKPSPLDFDALLADIAALEQAGQIQAAADAAASLLTLKPPLSTQQQAVLHARLADMLFHAERDRPVHNPLNARKLLEHSQAARDCGHPTTPELTLREALARHWLGDDEAAVSALQSALAGELKVTDRRLALRTLVELLQKLPQAGSQRRQALEQLLADPTTPLALFWWGLRQGVEDSLSQGDVTAARDLLARFGDRFTASDSKGYLDYLSACIAMREGRVEEAAPLAAWVEQWLAEEGRPNRQLDELGHLPSRNRCLIGQIHLAQADPQQAAADFQAVLEQQPEPEIRLAAQVGRGLALGQLGRHTEALEVLRAVAEQLQSERSRPSASAELLDAALALFQRQRAAGDYAGAIPYLELAVDLAAVGRSGRQLELRQECAEAFQAAADRTADLDLRRRYRGQAARHLEQAAEQCKFDEPQLSRLLWVAAGQYDQAGQIADARRVLRQFIAGRSEHPLLPQAILQLARADQASGELELALAGYARLISEYPRLEEAARAQVLSAEVLIALGPEHFGEAEQTLVRLLTDGWVTPDATAYRDGLLLLCDLLGQQKRYAEAIGRWQDFLSLYPADSERFRGQFMLADAHRQSAYGLRDSPPPGVSEVAAAAESRRRFYRAAELFAALVAALDQNPDPEPAQQAYLRLALFYRADCLFEVNEPDSLQDALRAYRTIAARYETHPACLAAQVQIANILLRLGDLPEAARAVERARWLWRGIPAEAYPRWGADRGDWERFLSVVASL